MHTRPFAPSDVAATATLAAQAFWDDKLFEWLCPRKDTYPDDFRKFFVRSIKEKQHAPGLRLFVSETDEEDADWTGTPVITGYAIWRREGKSSTAQAWRQDPLSQKLERYLIAAEDLYVRISGVDRCVDHQNLASFRIAEDSSFADIGEFWHLNILAVAPSFQRRGVGSLLLDWGQEQVEKEGVPAALEASPFGYGLYLKKGYRPYNSFTISEGLEAPALLLEPSGMKGKWGVKREVKVKE
ncbi:MAG: hypothetical protein M1833_002065 [Piccolia ochrophora]|nr:MAG: hypothetical protein M1833_002065 [Piccolia ochrophora]